MPNFIKSFLIAYAISFIWVTLSFLVLPIVDIFLPTRDPVGFLIGLYVEFVPCLAIFFWLFVHGTLYPYIPDKNNDQKSTPTTSDTTVESSPEKTSPERDA